MAAISHLVIEAIFLWLATAIVVAIASGVHYAMESSDLQELKQRVEEQSAKPERQEME